MRSFTFTYTELVKDLKLLNCGLPESYIRSHFLTLAGADSKYSNYINDSIISHITTGNGKDLFQKKSEDDLRLISRKAPPT